MKDKFIPEIIEKHTFNGEELAYAKMLVELQKCPECSRLMFRISSKRMKEVEDIFPSFHEINIFKQTKLGNIDFNSYKKNSNDQEICESCALKGKASFKCILCNEIRSSEQEQESFGYPPEFLCKICYASVPAKVWEEKVKKLYEHHKYDFE